MYTINTFNITNSAGEIVGKGRYMPGAKMTIDHGRVGTLKRREMFSKVTVILEVPDNSYAVIPNKAILSPRRIQRAIDHSMIDGNGADIADEVQGMLKEWSETDYQVTFGNMLPLLGTVGDIDIRMYLHYGE